MIFNVAQLLKADVGTTRHLEVDDWLNPLSESVRLTEPVRGPVTLIRTNRGILVRANLETAAELECSRCLTLHFERLPIHFSEEYIPIIDITTGAAANIPHESYAFTINERHELDLEAAVREYGILELPMAPLCSTNCAGLCPICGVNRNEQRCDCQIETRDERFAVLRSLFGDDNQQE